MKIYKEEFIEHCLHASEETICDTCGTNILIEFNGIPVTVEFGYGSGLDGESFEFCNLKCLSVFINEELKKSEEK